MGTRRGSGDGNGPQVRPRGVRAYLDDVTIVTSSADAGTRELRGQRYCEVLLATASATTVHVAVYNTA